MKIIKKDEIKIYFIFLFLINDFFNKFKKIIKVIHIFLTFCGKFFKNGEKKRKKEKTREKKRLKKKSKKNYEA